MDVTRQSGQMDGGRQAGQAGGVSADNGEPLSQRGVALRYRPWQRLRGQRAFRRERNVGVYRHSAAALVRILPPWELEQGVVPPVATGVGESATSQSAKRLPSASMGGEAIAGQQVYSSVRQSSGCQPSSATAGSDGATVSASRRSNRGVSATGRRLGVVASRKVGNAVARNRAKRVWREIFRLNQQLLPTHCDVLIIVRKDFATAQRTQLEALFADAARRAHRAFGAEKR